MFQGKSKKRGVVKSSHVEEKDDISVGDKEKETSSRSSDAAGVTCRLDEDVADSAGKTLEEESGRNIRRNRGEEVASNDEVVVRIGGGTEVTTRAKDVTEYIAGVESSESVPGGAHSSEYKEHSDVTVEDVIIVDSEKGDLSSASADSERKSVHESCLSLRDDSTVSQQEETSLVTSKRVPEAVPNVGECVTQNANLAQHAVDRSMTDDTGTVSHCQLPSQCSTVVQSTSEERKQVDHYDGIKASACALPDVEESTCGSPVGPLNMATTVSPATSCAASVVMATCESPAVSSAAPVVMATCESPAASSAAPVVMATCESPTASSVAPVVMATCESPAAPAASSVAPVVTATCESPAMSSAAPVVTATCESPAASSAAPVVTATCESPAASSVAPVVMATCESPVVSSAAPVVTATYESPVTLSAAPVVMATCESPAISAAPVVMATRESPATSSVTPVVTATTVSPATSSVAHVVTPLTEEQLATIYYNPELRLNEDFIEGFLQVSWHLLSIIHYFVP